MTCCAGCKTLGTGIVNYSPVNYDPVVDVVQYDPYFGYVYDPNLDQMVPADSVGYTPPMDSDTTQAYVVLNASAPSATPSGGQTMSNGQTLGPEVLASMTLDEQIAAYQAGEFNFIPTVVLQYAQAHPEAMIDQSGYNLSPSDPRWSYYNPPSLDAVTSGAWSPNDPRNLAPGVDANIPVPPPAVGAPSGANIGPGFDPSGLLPIAGAPAAADGLFGLSWGEIGLIAAGAYFLLR